MNEQQPNDWRAQLRCYASGGYTAAAPDITGWAGSCGIPKLI